MGIRPAEVCGATMYPSRSSTVISLRTVALETFMPGERATVCEPTGCAVATCSSTMARRIADFRSSRSIGSRFYRVPAFALGPNIQSHQETRHDLVRQEPAPPGQRRPVAARFQQAGGAEIVDAQIHRREVGAFVPKLDPVAGPQHQREPLSLPGSRIEPLIACLGRLTGCHRRQVPIRRADVPPAAGPPVTHHGVAVRRTANTGVFTLLPVEDVVTALLAGQGPVRDLVPVEAGGAEPVVGDLVLRGLVVVIGALPLPGRDRTPERGRGLHGERVCTHV